MELVDIDNYNIELMDNKNMVVNKLNMFVYDKYHNIEYSHQLLELYRHYYTFYYLYHILENND